MRIDVVGIFAQDAAQRVDGLVLAARRAGDPARARPCRCSRILLEEFLERCVRLAGRGPSAASASPSFLRASGSRGSSSDRAAWKHGTASSNALLQREHAAEVLVQVREVRLQRKRAPHASARPPRYATLLARARAPSRRRCSTEPGLLEVLAADLPPRARGRLDLQRLERRRDAGVGRGAGRCSLPMPRYLSNQSRTRTR